MNVIPVGKKEEKLTEKLRIDSALLKGEVRTLQHSDHTMW